MCGWRLQSRIRTTPEDLDCLMGRTMRLQPSYGTASQSTPYQWRSGSHPNRSLTLGSKMASRSRTPTKSLDLPEVWSLWWQLYNRASGRCNQSWTTVISTNTLKLKRSMPMYVQVSCGSGARKDQTCHCWIWARPLSAGAGWWNFMALSDGGVL